MCHDVRVEPDLQKLTGEEFNEITSNLKDEARVDVCACGFWTTGQLAFFDVFFDDKRGQNYNVVASWIRRKIFFSLMNSIGLCIRGSRKVFKTEAMMTSIQVIQVNQ